MLIQHHRCSWDSTDISILSLGGRAPLGLIYMYLSNLLLLCYNILMYVLRQLFQESWSLSIAGAHIMASLGK